MADGVYWGDFSRWGIGKFLASREASPVHGVEKTLEVVNLVLISIIDANQG